VLDFIEKFSAHLLPRSVIEPVQKPATCGRFPETAIRFETALRKKLLNFADRRQVISLPATKAQGTCSLHGPVMHIH
jgi:hypothetical protein